MVTRPADWSPLAGADPIPGDPEQVRAAAGHYRETATRIRTVAANLLAVTTSADAASEAVAAFRDQAVVVRTGILKAESRYAGLAAALDGYAPVLAATQAGSLAALTSARRAHSEAHAARSTEHHLQDQARQSSDPVELAEVGRRLRAERARADEADGSLEAARRQLAEAIELRDRAAQVATDAIDDVEATSHVNDSFWDKARKFAGDLADTIAGWVDEIGKVLDKVSGILLVLQVVLMVVAFVFPLAAGVVLAISVVLKVLKAVTMVSKVVRWVKTAALVVQIVTGRKPLSDVPGLLAGMAADKILGKLIDKGGKRFLAVAENDLLVSQHMRNVRAGMSDPGPKAAKWLAQNLGPEASTTTLLETYHKATELGRRSIALSVGSKLVFDYGADQVAHEISDRVTSVVDFVVHSAPVRQSVAPPVPVGAGGPAGFLPLTPFPKVAL